MAVTLNHALQTAPAEPEGPIQLFSDGQQAIYWIGISDQTAFRCNSYLIVDGEQALLIDPGSRQFFAQVRERVAQVLGERPVTGLVICHQDPDVAASIGDWLAVSPAPTLFTSPRTEVLLPHYGVTGYRFYDVEAEPLFHFDSGRTLRFIGAPFLHSPMAFATFDEASGALFSGDVFAAVDSDWRLVVTDFPAHAAKMDLFHIDYMASHVAARGFAERIKVLPIKAILPQHGSLIPAHHVADAIAYLEALQCGLDILYPDID